MKLFLFITIVLLVVMGVVSISMWYQFNNNCGDYLKLAGDAPTVERANEFLGKALSYIEAKNLTTGSSAIFFHRPNANLSIWHQQILGAKQTAKQVLERTEQGALSQLERDNALMKIREVLLDSGSDGTEVTTPPHIMWHPHQLKMLIGWLLCLLMFVVVFIAFVRD